MVRRNRSILNFRKNRAWSCPDGVIRRASRVDARDSESHDKTATGRMAERAKVLKTSEVPEHDVRTIGLLQCLK